jgi:hypothetical protein
MLDKCKDIISSSNMNDQLKVLEAFRSQIYGEEGDKPEELPKKIIENEDEDEEEELSHKYLL